MAQRLKTNYRKSQYVMTMRLTVMLDSAEAYITIPFTDVGQIPPLAAEDCIIKIYDIAGPTYALVGGGPGSLSGAYLYYSIFASGTSASLAADKSIITIVQWLVGSR